MKANKTNKKHDRNKVLAYIISYKRINDGISPSIRNICDACDIPSTSNAKYILGQLQEDGKISIIDWVSRGIKVIGGKWEYPTA